ncbi:hypothetical protein [Thiomonas sp. FB-Cd]|uniref:hypothetical protein n=1 Tax=Thiomonas sp. FB-Cd TaxID=1158292 RepID=UPI0004DEFB4B|nr:hypothetical protein [Thiomonas sp. FB-Cd]
MDPTSRLVDVDWNDPRLQELLKKTEGLRLDDRGTYKPRRIRVHPGWHPLGANRGAWVPALLVWDTGHGDLVIQMQPMPLRPGDPMTLDKAPNGVEARLEHGEIMQCRAGVRPEDEGKDVFLVWVHVPTPR